MMRRKVVQNFVMLLLLPFLFGMSMSAHAGMKVTLKFDKTPNGGNVKVEFESNGDWKEKQPGEDVLKGVKLRLTATPDMGKELASVVVNGKNETSKCKDVNGAKVLGWYAKQISKEKEEIEIEVTFKTTGEKTKSKLTWADVAGAKITVTVDGVNQTSGAEIEEGKDLNIKVDVNDAKQKVDWVKVGGQKVNKGTNDLYITKMPSAATTIEVRLVKKSWKINFSSAEGFEVGIMAGSKTVKPGETLVDVDEKLSIEVTKKPAGKDVDKVQLDDQQLTLTNGKYMADMPNKDAELKIISKTTSTKKLTIASVTGATVSVTRAGGVAVTDQSDVSVGEMLTITIEVTEAGKIVDKVMLGSTAATKVSENRYTVAMPNEAATLTVTLKAEQKHTLTIATVEGAKVKVMVGSKEVKTNEQVAQGAKLEIEVTVTNSTKKVEKVTLGNVPAVLNSTTKKYEVDMPTMDAELKVVLGDKQKYTFTFADGEGYTVKAKKKADMSDLTTNAELYEGDKVELTFTLTDQEKEITNVTVGTASVTKKDDKTYEFAMPAAAVTLSVTTVVKTYKVTFADGAGYTLKVFNTTTGTPQAITTGATLPKDAKLEFLVTVTDPTKQTEKVQVNGKDAQATSDKNKWTYTMKSEAITVTVTLADLPKEGNALTIEANGAEIEVVSGTTPVNSGDKLKKDAPISVTIKSTPENRGVKEVLLNTESLKLEDGKYVGMMPDAVATLKIVLNDPKPGHLVKITNNGATVEVKMANGDLVKPATKVAAGTELLISVTATPDKKDVDKITFEGTVLKPEADKKTYKAVMPDKDATLVVILKNITPVEDAVLAGVSVYPNPFVERLVVKNTAEVEKVTLVNLQGVELRVVLPAGTNQIHFAVEDLPAGVYMLVLERNGVKKTLRVVK